MKPFLLVACCSMFLLACSPQATAPAIGDANAAFQALRDGNARFVANRMEHPQLTPARRTGIAEGQHPIAMILSCADSRVPPELVFDRGLGELFVTRVAGHVVSDEVLGTLEYGVEQLQVPLIVVMGHERCGAVEAAVAGGDAPGHVQSVLKRIAPAVEEAQKHDPADLVEQSIRMNVKMAVDQIRQSQPVLASMIEQGKVKVVGARYDLDTGVVEWL